MHVLMLPAKSPTDAVLEAEHPLQTLPEWVQGPFILNIEIQDVEQGRV